MPRKPTHVVIQPAEVFAGTEGKTVVRKLNPGTTVTLVKTDKGFVLIAKDGKLLGYVAQAALAAMH